MIELSVAAAGASRGDRPALVDGEGAATWSAVAAAAAELATASLPAVATAEVDGDPAPVVRLESGRGGVLTLLAALELGVPLVLAPATWIEQQVHAAFPDPAAAKGLRAYATPSGRDPERTALVVATSGSSGQPKWARLSRRALVAAAVAGAERVGWNADGRWLLSLPASGVGGVSIVIRALVARGAIALGSGGRFEPASVIEEAARLGVTHLSLVPTMLWRVVRDEVSPPASLIAALIGGAHAPEELLAAAWRLGWPALPSWGATETCAQAATLPLEWWRDPSRAPGPLAALGCGLPLPGVELAVDDGQRLLVRGRATFSGYLGQPQRAEDEWHATGDLGRLDEHGCLQVLGRADAVILTGGAKVHPQTVESVLLTLPGVDAACVVGVVDAEWGERVGAMVAGQGLSAVALAAQLAGRLAGPERPRHIAVVDRLPQLESGKPDRVAIRAAMTAAAEER